MINDKRARVRVRLESGWEIWDNVKEIVIPYPIHVHTPDGELICVLPADLPTVTTIDDIDIRVLEVEPIYE